MKTYFLALTFAISLFGHSTFAKNDETLLFEFQIGTTKKTLELYGVGEPGAMPTKVTEMRIIIPQEIEDQFPKARKKGSEAIRKPPPVVLTFKDLTLSRVGLNSIVQYGARESLYLQRTLKGIVATLQERGFSTPLTQKSMATEQLGGISVPVFAEPNPDQDFEEEKPKKDKFEAFKVLEVYKDVYGNALFMAEFKRGDKPSFFSVPFASDTAFELPSAYKTDLPAKHLEKKELSFDRSKGLTLGCEDPHCFVKAVGQEKEFENRIRDGDLKVSFLPSELLLVGLFQYEDSETFVVIGRPFYSGIKDNYEVFVGERNSFTKAKVLSRRLERQKVILNLQLGGNQQRLVFSEIGTNAMVPASIYNETTHTSQFLESIASQPGGQLGDSYSKNLILLEAIGMNKERFADLKAQPVLESSDPCQSFLRMSENRRVQLLIKNRISF